MYTTLVESNLVGSNSRWKWIAPKYSLEIRRALCPLACEIEDFQLIDLFVPSPYIPLPGGPRTTKILRKISPAPSCIDIGAFVWSPDERVCMHARARFWRDFWRARIRIWDLSLHSFFGLWCWKALGDYENRLFWWPEQIENLKIPKFWWPKHEKTMKIMPSGGQNK